MIFRLQLLVVFSFFLIACTEDKDFDIDNKTVDIRLDNAEEITLGVVQSTFLTHLYLPIFDFLGESDLPETAVKVESIEIPSILEGGVLRCQDFTARTTTDVGSAYYCDDSPNGNGGVALYSFPANQQYTSGDKITAKYENYVNSLGWINNGRLEATYQQTGGLNRSFLESDSVSCLVNLQSDLSGRTKIEEINLLSMLVDADEQDQIADIVINDISLSSILFERDSNMFVKDVKLTSEELNAVFSNYELNGANLNGVKIIDVVGDGLRFINSVDAITVEVFGKVQIFDDNGNPVLEDGKPTFVPLTDFNGELILDDNDQIQYLQTVLATYQVNENEKLIVLNHASETTANQIATIEQDQLYSVVNLEVNEARCQSYHRELSASLTNFTVLKDGIEYGINGGLSMVEGTLDNVGFSHQIKNSTFTTSVKQENKSETYTMNNFSISYVQDADKGGYAFEPVLDGSISSSVFPGLLEVFQDRRVIGEDGADRPNTGIFLILGQGLERIIVTFKAFTLFLGIDYNGDSTGNQSSDVDFNIEPNWDDLINRDFIQPELP